MNLIILFLWNYDEKKLPMVKRIIRRINDKSIFG